MDNSLLQVRAPGVCFHVLRDADGLTLIDTGFIRGRVSLHCALRARGWDHQPVRGILLTHGHLDHILNVARLAEETGAWVAAPALDQLHYQGQPAYRGTARVAGFLETIGRPLLRFRPFVPERELADGDTLDLWHGLRTVHLPGHTRGHSGFYCEKKRLLFCGDLFASFGRFSHLPPAVFNHCGDQIPASVARALELDLNGILPNHCDRASPEEHLRRLQNLSEKFESIKTTQPRRG